MLEQSETTPRTTRSSRKEPLTDDEAAALIGKAKEVRIARGKKVVVQKSAESSIDDLKGPTGNYRAPILVVGKTLLVGFHQESLHELFGV